MNFGYNLFNMVGFLHTIRYELNNSPQNRYRYFDTQHPNPITNSSKHSNIEFNGMSKMNSSSWSSATSSSRRHSHSHHHRHRRHHYHHFNQYIPEKTYVSAKWVHECINDEMYERVWMNDWLAGRWEYNNHCRCMRLSL